MGREDEKGENEMVVDSGEIVNGGEKMMI